MSERLLPPRLRKATGAISFVGLMLLAGCSAGSNSNESSKSSSPEDSSCEVTPHRETYRLPPNNAHIFIPAAGETRNLTYVVEYYSGMVVIKQEIQPDRLHIDPNITPLVESIIPISRQPQSASFEEPNAHVTFTVNLSHLPREKDIAVIRSSFCPEMPGVVTALPKATQHLGNRLK